MSPEEMSRYIQFLFEQIQQKDAQHKELLEQIVGIKGELKQANSEQKRLNSLVLSLTNQLNDALQANAEQSRIIADLQSSARVSKKHCFGSSSQKGITKTKEVAGRDDGKDEFDGTASSLSSPTDVTEYEDANVISDNRVSRKGCTNTKMSADYQVLHECDCESQIQVCFGTGKGRKSKMLP